MFEIPGSQKLGCASGWSTEVGVQCSSFFMMVNQSCSMSSTSHTKGGPPSVLVLANCGDWYRFVRCYTQREGVVVASDGLETQDLTRVASNAYTIETGHTHTEPQGNSY
jgi:hypothetical protein